MAASPTPPDQNTCPSPIAITGASGLVGKGLRAALDHAPTPPEVLRLVRRSPQDSAEVHWDPLAAEIDHPRLAGCGAVVHLAGENVAGGRWTPEVKRAIEESRTVGTRTLVQGILALPPDQRPPVFVSASATGYYPNGAPWDREFTEDHPPADTFLGRVCAAWEREAKPLEEAGIRVVHLRIGVVLHPDGGALQKMLPFFKLGLGGRLGHGRQGLPWITREDLVAMFLRTLTDGDMRGPYNAVAPEVTDNRAFTKALGKVLKRPTFLPVPPFGLRMLYGEMADALLLKGPKTIPQRMVHAGFEWQHPELEGALRHVLQKG